MNRINGTAIHGGKSIPYMYLKQEETSNTLAILLPGLGYTNQAPLLFYTTSILASKGYDVLQVNYKYSREEMSTLKEKDFTDAILEVIQHILEKQEYEHYVLVAKSMGTIALFYLLENPLFQSAKVVWQTPLLQRDDVYNSLRNSESSGLLLIGDKDPCYIEERVSFLRSRANLSLQVIEKGDHGLELKNDVFGSINILSDIVRIIDDYI
ncbi:alpha/beta family hydrolase [Robertmurraya massiliosenegalensis]|uniref:alpha/beta family hydrolase n=1 Tax=Robertmurraya TaxID=2837507 RepID=UPI0039A62B1C